MEQAQDLSGGSSRRRQELQLEMERLRSSQQQAERTLDARERAHRQRVKGLEEQVSRWALPLPRTSLLPVLSGKKAGWVWGRELFCPHTGSVGLCLGLAAADSVLFRTGNSGGWRGSMLGLPPPPAPAAHLLPFRRSPR